jgi:hypothetical protein
MNPMPRRLAILDEDANAHEDVKRREDLQPRIRNGQLRVQDARSRQRRHCDVEPVHDAPPPLSVNVIVPTMMRPGPRRARVRSPALAVQRARRLRGVGASRTRRAPPRASSSQLQVLRTTLGPRVRNGAEVYGQAEPAHCRSAATWELSGAIGGLFAAFPSLYRFVSIHGSFVRS